MSQNYLCGFRFLGDSLKNIIQNKTRPFPWEAYIKSIYFYMSAIVHVTRFSIVALQISRALDAGHTHSGRLSIWVGVLYNVSTRKVFLRLINNNSTILMLWHLIMYLKIISAELIWRGRSLISIAALIRGRRSFMRRQ